MQRTAVRAEMERLLKLLEEDSPIPLSEKTVRSWIDRLEDVSKKADSRRKHGKR